MGSKVGCVSRAGDALGVVDGEGEGERPAAVMEGSTSPLASHIFSRCKCCLNVFLSLAERLSQVHAAPVNLGRFCWLWLVATEEASDAIAMKFARVIGQQKALAASRKVAHNSTP